MTDFTWTGAVSNLFSDPGNWSPSGPPDASGTTTILAGSTITLDENAHLHSLVIDGTGTATIGDSANHLELDSNLDLSDGQTLDLGGAFLQVDSDVANGHTGTVGISNGTMNYSTSFNVNAGLNVVLTNVTYNTTSSITGPGTVTLAGTTMNFTGAEPTGNFVFGDVPENGTNNFLNIPEFGGQISSISNFGYGDSIDAGGQTLELVDNLDGTYSLHATEPGGPTICSDVTLAPGANAADFGMSGANFTYEGAAPCFCAGARILTDRGEVLVEDLHVGDLVVTVTGEAKPIVWVGSGRVRLQPWHKKPVIVRAGALADGLPHRDLRLTEGHSLFVDGMLIPVSSLVNGRSILWDEEAVQVEYYHIEVEGHDVVLAEGAPTETYRNDGNRKYFLMGVAGPDHRLTSADEVPSYAPIVTDGPELDRVWRRLSDRAGRAPTSREADIHLLVDGRRVDPDYVSESRYRFSLGETPRQVSLASATFRPSDIGTRRDSRMLGIAVRALTLRAAGMTTFIEHRCPSLSEGWQGDKSEFRWTSGGGRIPLVAGGYGPVTIEIEVAMTGKYPLPVEEPAEASRSRAA